MKVVQTSYTAAIFVTLTICGSSGSLSEQFNILFQNSFKISNNSGLFLKETFDVGYGKGYAYVYTCVIDQVIKLMSDGTKRLTGIDANYIAEVLNGQNPPPFQSQLSCINVGLTEMQKEVRNARNWAKMSRECFKVPKTIYKTCDEFANSMKPHQEKISEIFIPKISAYIKYIKNFESIGMLDLFENYIHATAVCHIETVGIISSNFAHVDQQEGIDYVKGQTKELSFPLSCISNVIDMEVSRIKAAYGEIVKEC